MSTPHRLSRSIWHHWLASIALVLVATATAAACLWDSDTLRMESESFPGVAEVLTGRFERQPPKYYQMRLDRVSRLLEKDATLLDAYDDAGVACDRLGRSDDAIAWMTRKAEALVKSNPKAVATKDHQYRYHSNLGTFHAHRWIRSGADRSNLADLKTAEAEIAEAIRINPDAHFGREKYQLAAIRWLIELPAVTRYEPPTFLRALVQTSDGLKDPSFSPADAVKGLAGLIVMGDAWQSVDVHWALGAALRGHYDSSIAYLARLRMQELISQGRKSFHPSFDPERRVLQELGSGGSPYLDAVRDIDAYFTKARAAADTWQQARWEFMEARFALGKHPDTHADFWSGWSHAPAPELPDESYAPLLDRVLFWAVVSIAAIAASLVARFLIRRLRRAATR